MEDTVLIKDAYEPKLKASLTSYMEAQKKLVENEQLKAQEAREEWFGLLNKYQNKRNRLFETGLQHLSFGVAVKGHNRKNCPNKDMPLGQQNGAVILWKHDAEKDMVVEVNQKIDKLTKQLQALEKMYQLRQALIGRSLFDNIRDKLLLEIPEQ